MDDLPHKLRDDLRIKAVYLTFHWLNDSWTHGFEIVTHGFELITRGFEIYLVDLNSQLVDLNM